MKVVYKTKKLKDLILRKLEELSQSKYNSNDLRIKKIDGNYYVSDNDVEYHIDLEKRDKIIVDIGIDFSIILLLVLFILFMFCQFIFNIHIEVFLILIGLLFFFRLLTKIVLVNKIKKLFETNAI